MSAEHIKTPTILIDADACPVKDETYRVAERYDLPVYVVANSYMRIPREDFIKQIVVSDGFDAADDWIAERASTVCIVITADILLAERCVTAGATVIAPTGKPFTENSIGGQVATRAIMADLRAGAIGNNTGGPAPFSKADRSRFLQALDLASTKLKRSV
ncbi:MAG: YaiI/YqxD family protein [Pseudomonadota bacterium]